MKLLVTLGLLCAIACAVQAQFPGGRGGNGRGRIGGGGGFKLPHRFRRSPQGSVVLEAQKPLSGPDRQPTLNLNYDHQIIDTDRTKLNAFGGASAHGGRVVPQAGLGFEHRFKNNVFVHGSGNVQPGMRHRFEPSFNAGLGWRFRREAMPYDEDQAVEEEIEETF